MNVLLIGGNKGLGRSIAVELDKQGHKRLALNRANGGLDLTWPEGKIKEHIKAGIEWFDGERLDALIISSGAGAYYRPTVSADTVERLFRVNFLGPTTVFRACQRSLLKSKGKVIFISSIVSRKPSSGGLSYYAATKGSIDSFVRAEARRQAKHGIAVCAVSPGFFDSPMTQDIHPKAKAASMKNIPFGRFGTTQEIAKFTVNLLNQSNWCLAGSIYEVSGGS